MMRKSWTCKVLLGLACSTLLLRSQRLTWYERYILEPNTQTVSGVVTTEDGRPIAGAHIDHTDVREQEQLFTDDEGRFHLDTRAPALVVRKLGFDGERVHIDGSAPLRIVLHRDTATLPVCKSACVGLKSRDSMFCFPSVPGVAVSDQGQIGDTVSREFLVSTHDGPREILLGSGPTWSVGVPFTSDVWESLDYSEKAYVVGDSQIIDARGKTPQGKVWRFLGRFGESASYYEVPERDAAVPNRLLDDICISAEKEKE